MRVVLYKFILLFSLFGVAFGDGFKESYDGWRTSSWQAEVTSVREALKSRNEASVRLVGSIVRRVSDDDYEFSDGKHKIIVEIEGEAWGEQEVTLDDLVEIFGRVEVKFGYRNKIEASSVRVLE